MLKRPPRVAGRDACRREGPPAAPGSGDGSIVESGTRTVKWGCGLPIQDSWLAP